MNVLCIVTSFSLFVEAKVLVQIFMHLKASSLATLHNKEKSIESLFAKAAEKSKKHQDFFQI